MCDSFVLKPLADYDEVKVVIPTFVKLLSYGENLPTLTHIINLLYNLLIRYRNLPTNYLDANFISSLCNYAS